MNTLLKNKQTEVNLANFHFNSGLRLDALAPAESKALEDKATTIYVQKQSTLYTEGEVPKGVYYVVNGKIKVSQLNMNGAVQNFFIYSTGEMFGHRPILSREKHPVTATALEDCELRFIEKDHFINVLASSPELSQLFLQNICHEFTVLVNRINIYAQRGIKERLAYFLLLLNEKFKSPGQSPYEAEIKMSRGDLANFIGTSIETLVRMLQQFKQMKYIRTVGKSIYINDFDGLLLLSAG